MKKVVLMSCFVFIAACIVAAQSFDLNMLIDGKNCQVYNRKMSTSAERKSCSLNEMEGDGIVWIDGLTFQTGTIELDIRGKNKPGQSFVGIAFHGADDETFEGVYFRPFNFRSPVPERQSHSVQYISMPEYDWSVLRESHPGVYENKLTSNVDPDSWFHARIVVAAELITVYVNKDASPALTVRPLAGRPNGKLGLWVGNYSGGDFSALKTLQ